MMRSMYSAVSSLRAHQLRMDVIGNNIANINTVGFKGSRVTFQEVFSQTLRGAGRPQENGRGGTNPQQVGLGADVNSMDTFHMRGSVESTGYNTDLMINGDGFFIVSDTESGLNRSYTRAGNFCIDEGGNLLTSDGFYVLGYRYEDGKVTEGLKGLKISRAETSPPKATTKAVFEGNIDSNLKAPYTDSNNNNIPGEDFSTIMKVYDSLGNAHNVKVVFERIGDAPPNRQYTVDITEIDGITTIGLSTKFILEFNTEGELVTGAIKHNKNNPRIETIIIADSTTAGNPPEVNGTGTTFNGASSLRISLDFTGLKNYSALSDAAALEINGYPSGKLNDFVISTTGEIEGVFSNGQTKILGQLRLANFKNPTGLLRTGSNMYRETANSGEAMYGYPASGGFANLQPGSLEMSNVDLSREFTDMITTQRGFQANSRVVTASDEMLQELVNMKR